MDQHCPKRVDNKKSEQHHWILHIRITLAMKFRLKLTNLTFWTKFVQKGHFRSKNVKSKRNHWLQVSHSTDNTDNLDQICPKKSISGRKQHHWILHIQISLGIKFHLKLTIVTIWTKFAQKGHFWSKTKKSEQGHWFLHIRISLCIKFHFKLTILTI